MVTLGDTEDVLSVRAPVPGAVLSVRRRTDTGALFVSFRDEWVSAGVAEYGGSWTFPAMSARKGPAHLLLLDAVLMEAYGSEEDRRPERERLSGHPFWREFVEAVERAWPVSDVMLT